MPEFAISRHYKNTTVGKSPTLDDKILVFEDRVLGWHLNITELIRHHMEAKEQLGTEWNHAGFVLMQLCFTYFEMIAQYKSGKSSDKASKKMFCEGLEEVFPGKFSEDTRKEIYSRIRCGMYHNGFIKKGVMIHGDYPESIMEEVVGQGETLIKVNPHKLSPALVTHFRRYIAELKDAANVTLRSNFETVFDS